MKKLALIFSIISANMLFAQYYPNERYGGSYHEDYYNNYPHDFEYFPDDYYYEYPSDYYSESYYYDIYKDYKRAINMVNWNSFFRQHRLSSVQINMIIELNRQFPSYNSWNSYYRMNPKRWWYDRFYALERILGPQVFIVFQNNYYHGSSPIYYYNNYWSTHYAPRYVVAPRYRTVHIDHYRINRDDYHRNTSNSFGGKQITSSRSYSGFSSPQRYNNTRSGSISGFSQNQGNSTFSTPRNSNNNFQQGGSGNFNNSGNSGVRQSNGTRQHSGFSNSEIRNSNSTNANTKSSFRTSGFK